MEKKVKMGIFAFVSPQGTCLGRQCWLGLDQLGMETAQLHWSSRQSEGLSWHHRVIPPAQGWLYPGAWAWGGMGGRQRGTAWAGRMAGRGSALASLLK